MMMLDVARRLECISQRTSHVSGGRKGGPEDVIVFECLKEHSDSDSEGLQMRTSSDVLPEFKLYDADR